MDEDTQSLYPLIGMKKSISPLKKRIVFFRANEIEYEVHPSITRERKSITGWLKDKKINKNNLKEYNNISLVLSLLSNFTIIIY